MPIITRNSLSWDDDEIDQLWAEAWQQYVQGAQWWPTIAEQAILEPITDAHTERTPIEEKLKAMFDWQGSLTVTDGKRLSATELFGMCFPNKHPQMAEMKATTAAVRRLWRANGAQGATGEERAFKPDGTLIAVYSRGGKACGCAMPKQR
jgi:hypothetical protein